MIYQSSAVKFQQIPHSFHLVVFSFQASKMFWACFVQFSQNTRFCSTPAVTRGWGRRVEPWRPSCFLLNTGESAFDPSSGTECHVIFHLQLSKRHEVVTVWFHQWLTCFIIFYFSTNVTELMSFQKHELIKLCCVFIEAFNCFSTCTVHSPSFSFICLVTHTSQSCLHGCLRCWAHPRPSSSVFTPCFRMKFRSWWVNISQTFSDVFVWMQSLDIWSLSSGLRQFHVHSLML